MTDSLAAEFERAICARRLMSFDCAWDDEIIFPCYDGLSIRNLAHTVVRLLDSKTPTGRLGTSPLDARLWAHLQGQVRRVVVFLSDGLGWRLLNEIMAEDADTAQIVADLVGDGSLTPITSIAPSTTAAALPAIWTGAGPAATGMVGTQLFLREFGTLVSMLHYTPLSGRHRSEALEDWGLDFNTFVPLETLGEVLGSRRIPTYLLLQKDLLGSGLSRIMHRGIDHVVRHYGYTDMWVSLRDLLRRTRRERCFVNIYWGAVDAVSHLYGTVTEQSITEIRRQLADLREVLASEEVSDGRTLFMLVADHGHTPVPTYLNVNEHPPLAEALRCGLGGEGRLGYLYLRHDFRPQAWDYITQQWGSQVVAFHPGEALAAGLFGPEKPHPETAARLGDLAVLARREVVIGDRPARPMSISRHGGLSDREMLVPLLMRVM